MIAAEHNYHDDTIFEEEAAMADKQTKQTKQELGNASGSNTKVWDYLSVTDPKYTKQFRRKGGFSGTDISPTFRQKVMTELFGVAGHGWGWEIERCWEANNCVFVQLNVWTRLPGSEGNSTDGRGWVGSQIGGTEIGRTPDESYKMAVTDAFGKCCAALGVGADVYSGQFDDSKYQRSAANVHEKRDIDHWSYTLDELEQIIGKCSTSHDLEKLHRKVANSNPPSSVHKKLKALFDKARERVSA